MKNREIVIGTIPINYNQKGRLKIKQHSKRVLAITLSCLTIVFMLTLALPTARATTDIIYKTNDTPYSVDGYETGQWQYCYHTVQPGTAYGYVKVGCSHTSSCCYRMNAQATYSGSTMSKTVYMYVHVSYMGYTETGGSAITRFYMRLTDETTGQVLYTNSNVNWRPIVAGTGWQTYSTSITLTNGHTYRIACGPYAGSNGQNDAAEAIGTVDLLRLYYN